MRLTAAWGHFAYLRIRVYIGIPAIHLLPVLARLVTIGAVPVVPMADCSVFVLLALYAAITAGEAVRKSPVRSG